MSMTKCHLGRGLLEYFLCKGVGFGEEVAYSIYIYIFRASVGATKTLNLAVIEVKLNIF